MLVTSILSFSQNVFKRPLPQGHQKLGLCGKGLVRIVWERVSQDCVGKG